MPNKIWFAGDHVRLVSVENTINIHGGNIGEAEGYLDFQFQVRKGNPMGGDVIFLENDDLDYYWHPEDFEPVYRKVKAKPKPVVTRNPLWVSKVRDNTLGATREVQISIHYGLYQPQRGDITRPPSYHDIKKRKKYSWISGNHACFASLEYQRKHLEWVDENTHIITYLELSNDKTSLSKKEIASWIRYLKKYTILPKKAICNEYNESGTQWTCRWPLENTSMRRLYMTLCMVRNVHEQPWLVRNTMFLRKEHRLNFFVAYALSHYRSHVTYGGHAVFSSSDFGWGKKATPEEIFKRGAQLEIYTYETSWKETSVAEKKGGGGFGLQNTVKYIKADVPEDVMTFKDFKGASLKHT